MKLFNFCAQVQIRSDLVVDRAGDTCTRILMLEDGNGQTVKTVRLMICPG